MPITNREGAGAISSEAVSTAAAPPESGLRRSQLAWILTTFLMVVLLDQITKAIIIALLEPDMLPRREVFFHFTHQRNEGLVGGTFSDLRAITFLAPMIATLVLIYLFRFLDPRSRLQALAYGMVFGGAIGNIVDRIVHGSVTDFLQFNFHFIPFDFPWKYYPAFNVADSAICVGVVLLVLSWNSATPPKVDAAPTL